MQTVMLVINIVIIISLYFMIYLLERIYKCIKSIKYLENTKIVIKERPKPRPGGLVKNKVSVNTEASIWEREQNGHARSTDQIV